MSTRGSTHALLPLLGQIQAAVHVSRIEVRLWWQPGRVEPLLPRDRRDLFLDLRVAVPFKEVQEGLFELEGVEGLVRPGLEVVRDELVKVLATYEPVQIVKKVEPLFVRYRAKRVLWVYTLVIDDEFRELMVGSKECDRVL